MSAQAIRVEKIQEIRTTDAITRIARVKVKPQEQLKLKVISLFSGAGGMDLAFQRAGFFN